jgi:hypothetical protein
MRGPHRALDLKPAEVDVVGEAGQVAALVLEPELDQHLRAGPGGASSTSFARSQTRRSHSDGR